MVRSVIRGATPDSFHVTVNVEPPVTDCPGVGEVKTTSQRPAGTEERRIAKMEDGSSAARILDKRRPMQTEEW